MPSLPMRCLTCEYDLSHLSEGVHRCPECGRVFDAADPQTYARSRRYPGWLTAPLIIICLTSPVWLPLLVVWVRRLF